MKKLHKTKRLWKICKAIANISTLFWIVETMYFIFAYGWHYKAICDAEQTCDTIVYCGWSVALFLLVWVLVDALDYLFTPKD